jgi:hypothetical protein
MITMGSRNLWGNVLFALGGLLLAALILLVAAWQAGQTVVEIMPGAQNNPANILAAIVGATILMIAIVMLGAGWRLTRNKNLRG